MGFYPVSGACETSWAKDSVAFSASSALAGGLQWPKRLPREARVHLLPRERATSLVHHLADRGGRPHGG